MCGAAVGMVCLERWGADRGSRGQKAVWGMVHAKLAGDRSGGITSVEYTAHLSSLG
jgi:hypothetical protein